MNSETPPTVENWTARFAAAWDRFWFTPRDPVVFCLLRSVTGLVALYLLITWTGDLVAFFGQDGLLPASAVSNWAEPYRSRSFPLVSSWSYLSYISDPTALWVSHLAAIVVLTAFTVGVLTRVTSILALVIFLSYTHRAPFLVSQVEPIVAMVLFYLCLAPCGACLSFDVWRRLGLSGQLSAPPSVAANIATRLLQIHTAAMYVMIALAQLAGGSASPWWDGQAGWALISRPEMPLLDLTFLARFPFLLDFGTRFIIVVELAFPVLVWQRSLRTWMLATAAVMWAGLAMITGLTPFCLMMVVASLAFLPAETLRQAIAKTSARRLSESTVTKADESAGSPMPSKPSDDPPRDDKSRDRGQPPRRSGKPRRPSRSP